MMNIAVDRSNARIEIHVLVELILQLTGVTVKNIPTHEIIPLVYFRI